MLCFKRNMMFVGSEATFNNNSNKRLYHKNIKLNNETEKKGGASIMKISAHYTGKKTRINKGYIFANKFLTFLTHSILLFSKPDNAFLSIAIQ